MDGVYSDDQQTTFNILSIDPGTHNLGYAVFELDIESLEIKKVHAWTVDATRLQYYMEEVATRHGDKFARILAHKKNFREVLDFYNPLMVVYESPFFNMQRASAAGPLYELQGTYEQTLFEWDPYRPLHKVEPKTVKKGVGASASAKKPEMKEAISKIEELKCLSLDFLDEHSIDAVAVGYQYINNKLRIQGAKRNV